MNKRRALRTRLTMTALATVALFASALPSAAQSCALCYTQAASAGGRMIEALKSGILILVIPPTLMSIAMAFIMYRHRNRYRDAASTADSDVVWSATDLSNPATAPWHRPTR
ncbi:MAG: hypothetical protein ACRD3H_16970 [Terriglobales bacterium]